MIWGSRRKIRPRSPPIFLTVGTLICFSTVSIVVSICPAGFGGSSGFGTALRASSKMSAAADSEFCPATESCRSCPAAKLPSIARRTKPISEIVRKFTPLSRQLSSNAEDVRNATISRYMPQRAPLKGSAEQCLARINGRLLLRLGQFQAPGDAKAVPIFGAWSQSQSRKPPSKPQRRPPELRWGWPIAGERFAVSSCCLRSLASADARRRAQNPRWRRPIQRSARRSNDSGCEG
jgi:hypothetical protein